MVDISRLSRLINGVSRGVALNENTLVVDNLKIKMGSGNDAFHATFAGTLTAARTITMPDANVNLGDIATNKSAIDGHLDGGVNKHDASEIDVEAVDGVDYSAGDLETVIGALDDALQLRAKSSILASSVNGEGASLIGIEDSAAQFTSTNVEGALAEAIDAAQAAQADVDNVELALGNSNVSNMGAYSGTIITDNQSAKQNIQELETYAEQTRSLVQNFEFKDSALDYIVDNTLVPPSEVSGDRYVLSHDGGAPNAAWDGASAGDIVEFDGTLWVATTPTLGSMISIDDESSSLRQWGGSSWDQKFFESTTASGLLTKVDFDIQMASSTAGNIIVYNVGGVASSVTMSGQASISHLGAITLNNDAVIAKLLTGYTAGSGVVSATDSIISAIQKLDGNIADHLADAVDAHDASAISYAGGDLVGADVEAALDDAGSRILALESAPGAEAVIEDGFVAGETLTAGLRAVRFAQDAETLGRIYLADNDAATVDNFYAFGVVLAAGELAAATVDGVYKLGKMTATAHGLTVGKPFYLGASGALTSTMPTTADIAVVKLGLVKDANTLEIQPQVMYVN